MTCANHFLFIGFGGGGLVYYDTQKKGVIYHDSQFKNSEILKLD